MQLFNGRTMGILSSYRVNYNTDVENGGTSSGSEVNYETELPKVQQNVDALKNEVTIDDIPAKEALNRSITDNFCRGINGYLKDKIDKKQELTTSLQEALKKHPDDESLKKLKTALGLDSKPEDSLSENTSVPTFRLDGLNATDIKEKKDNEQDNISTYIKTEKPNDEEGLEENVKLYQTKTKAEELSKKIVELLKNENLKENDNLNKTKKLVENINKILNNLTKDNIKLLQKFIFNNLDEDKKVQFKKDNYYNDKSDSFDGRLGKSTLGSLNDLGKKIEEYVSSFEKNNSAIPESQEAEDLLKDVEVRESINLPEGDAQIKAADLLEGTLPDGATAEFKNNAGIDKSKTDEQEVTVVVKSGDKTKEITIIATVDTTNKKVGLKIKENGNTTTSTATETTPTSETTETSTTPTGPLEITINGQAEEHPVVTSDVAKKINTPLYYVNTGNEAASEQNNKVDENGDREYLMQVNNETYKVKLDQNGNLKPLAINYESGAKLLLKNNPSCIAYLQSKIPANLPGNPQIAWNSGMEDYVIRSYGKGLTIEPMTLDGKWVAGNNLGNNLALLNFTNFLRGSGSIDNLKFKNDNPDLKFDDDKLYVRIKKGTRLADNSKSGKWYEVNLSKFGISQDALKNFIKYNNGEHWQDNWDKKDDNKGYNKIDFPNISVQVAVSAPASDSSNSSVSNLNNSSASDLSNSVVSSNDLHSSGVDQSVVDGTSLNQSSVKLNEVVVVSTIFKPKNPIVGVGAGESEWDIGGKNNANFDGLGRFKDGKFTFDAGVLKEGGKMNITGNEYDKVKIGGDGLIVDGNNNAFTGQGYYVGDIIRDQKDSSKNIKYLYYGSYENGLWSGKGTRVFENGAKYEGEWREGKEEGIGKYTYTNGDTYEGTFVGGKFEGNGKFTFKESGVVVDGKFNDNKFVSGNVALNGKSYQVERDEKGLKITSEGDNKNQYIDLAKGDILGTATDSGETGVRTVTAETLDIKSLDVNQLNSRLSVALSSMPGLKPESISKIKFSTEIDDLGEHVTFVNGVHGVNVNIDGILSDENVFGEAKLEDRIKLLFLASWQFCNRLNKIDSISFRQNGDSNVMLLHSGNSSSYIYYSEYGLDKNTTEKFFNSYNSLISRFDKEVSNEVKLSLDKAKNLKGLFKDVDVQDKEIGIMMMLMCGKENDFISKVEASGVIDAFNAVRSDCLSQLEDGGGKAVMNIIGKYKSSGETDFLLHLANYITLTDGGDFVKKYNECSTMWEKLDLVNSKIDQYNKIRGDVEDYIYKGEGLGDDV